MENFQLGDLVHLKKNIGESKYIISDVDAIITRADFNPNRGIIYALFLKDNGNSAWYSNDDLILIEKNRIDLIETWEEEIEKRIEKEKIKSQSNEYDSVLHELCIALGWQGGTIHQVIAEIKRLKN